MNGTANRKPAGKNKKVIKKYVFVWSILLYPTVLFLIFYLGINLNSILLAFQKIDIIDNTKAFVFLDNFKDFISSARTDMLLKNSLVNSLKMYAINLVICVPLYIIFSYYIYKKFFGSKLMRIIVKLPTIVSSFIICLLFKKFLESALPDLVFKLFRVKLPNLLTDARYTFGTSLFYMIWISFSTSLIVYPNAMNEVSEEVIESCQLDGCNLFQELWFIILPLIYPTVSTFLITGVAGIFTNGGPIFSFYMYAAYPEVYNAGYYFTVKTLMVKSSAEYPFLAAGGVILTLIMAPLTYLVKYLLEKYGPVTEY